MQARLAKREIVSIPYSTIKMFSKALLITLHTVSIPYSTIKIPFPRISHSADNSFQFLTVRLKSERAGHEIGALEFQFLTVRLKYPILVIGQIIVVVSIPYSTIKMLLPSTACPCHRVSIPYSTIKIERCRKTSFVR